jgi:hypothetical protein
MMRASRQAVIASLCTVIVLGVLPAAPVLAAEEPLSYDPLLSLVGNCDTSTADPVPDPGCPGGIHPPSGHLKRPWSVAIDAYGNEYVSDLGNESGTAGRITIFDDEGNFISELPDPHGPRSIAVDKKGTLYVFESVPGVTEPAEIARYYPTAPYEPEAGKIAYDPASRVVIETDNLVFSGSLAVDWSTDRLFVMLREVLEFQSVDELASPDKPNLVLNSLSDPAFQNPRHVAVDGQRRRLFVSSCKDEALECGVRVYKADPPYEFLTEIDGSTTPAGKFVSEQGLLSIAINEETGHFFIGDFEKQNPRIYEFGPSFEYISTINASFLQTPFFSQMAVSNSLLNPAAANRHYLFAPITPISPGPKNPQEVFAFHRATIGPPVVEGPKALNISETEGLLQATIDPNGGATTYTIALEVAGSGVEKVVRMGSIPGGALPTLVAATLSGLQPGTSYRFRVLATSDEGSDVEEGVFATYADAPLSLGTCPNEQLRVGMSSSLPDCRAFELVTPPDTNGRPIRGGGYPIFPFASTKASPDGNRVSFITEGGPLPGFEGTGSIDGDRYRAVRGASGWSPVRFGPTGTETETPRSLSTSPDQGYGFLQALGDGTAVIGGFGNTTNYLQYPDGHSELIGIGSLGVDTRAEGKLITENATHVIFQTENQSGGNPHPAVQLEPNAPPDGVEAVYDRTPGGITHVVSLLPPDDTTPLKNASYVGASRDGTGIAFEIDGTLYLRSNNAASFEIGENVVFAGVAEGGQRIFYVEGGDLLAFDAAGNEVIEFTRTGNAKVVNVAPNGQRAYFVSTSVISEAGENPNGVLPKGGQQNLYLSEEGLTRFVGIVTQRDVEGAELGGELEGEGLVDGLGLWTTAAAGGSVPSKDPSRVNPTGSVLLFQSRANLDGHGESGDPQIFRFDSQAERLHCISCNPTGLVEGGGASLETFTSKTTGRPPIGSRIEIQNITPDGNRAVFESKEALVSTDNDAVQDIYEWEEAGIGSCTRAGGCVHLLSSGHSAEDNYLFGMSRTGDDVFFVTGDVLVPGDDDTASIYDARVGGGFLPQPEVECNGEGCRPGLSSPPALASPGSPARGAHDNVRSRKCPKGKRKVKRHGKVRCVKKHRKKHRKHQATNKKRGTGR